MNRFGGMLVGLALVAVLVAYPPPFTGIAPLLGVGNVLLPLIVSVASLLVAIIGCVYLARGFTEEQSDRTERLLVRILVPVIAVVVMSAYLVTAAGFAPQSSFIIGSVILAIVVGVADEVIS